eukprot:scaffold9020_cov89-Skeletonema_dohrnii-CCMP3373.AAC.2
MSLGMGMGFGGVPSAHTDVLSASPEDVPSKLRLVEEIKSRGRACVGCKNYPDAASLYTKGIEVLSSITDDESAKKEAAILYSNRSLVLLQMGKVSEALESADSACENDPTYVKAHWRRGQACNALGNTADALASFERALSLEPANKALKREVEAAKAKKEQEEKLLAAAKEAKEAEAEADIAEPPKLVSPAKKEAAKANTTKPTSSAKSSNKNSVKEDEDTDLFTSSDHVRGYKIRSDGKKTSFFDREISEESKQLIGDIAPKRIDPNAPTEDNAPKPLPVTEGTSAWNKAGTWEERDVTSWAKETLEAALLTSEYILPEGSPSPGARATVSKVSKFEGHASYATVRGKKRYIYEFAFTLDWVLTLGDDHTKTCHGKVTFPDVDGTVELGDGYDIVDYHVDGSSPAGTGPLLQRFIRDGGLRESIHNKIDDWVRLLRATY